MTEIQSGRATASREERFGPMLTDAAGGLLLVLSLSKSPFLTGTAAETGFAANDWKQRVGKFLTGTDSRFFRCDSQALPGGRAAQLEFAL
jgi:hypothetical protein